MADLILLHGVEHGSWCWKPLRDELGRGNSGFDRLITVDMPSCGRKRGRVLSRLTLASIAGELNDELRNAQVAQGIMLGHSIAGILLPIMALEDPTRYSRLIYLGTALPDEGQSIMELLGTSLHGEDPDHVGWPIELATATPEELSMAMFGQDLSEAQLA
ncbi:alpha/beta fold hydrolase [Stutzerimonas kunmingensis]|uniref:alpha/beta fold hydrolase n=1 Tax=Stutzerimonas kunmingensis TaxID=1211807 RepID=UPI0028AEC8CF|nr:alpha/beta fold hydrolase [Stutzerimonas kunmingensis]